MLFTLKRTVSGTQSRAKPLFLMALLLLFFSLSASAGIFSFLAKAGKLGKAPDVDLPSTKLELPDNFKEFSIVSISQDAGGNWLIKQPDGTLVRLDTAGSSPVDGNKVVLTLKADDLPHSLDQFDSLPADMPIFIRGKKGHLFELKREPSPVLVYKNVRLPVTNSDEIHEALWLLQRPSAAKGVRFVQLSDRTDNVLPEKVYGSRLVVESVGQGGLLASMSSMKRQTLVLSGRIEKGRLFGGGKWPGGILLRDLRQSAADNDIKLLILESDHPAAVLKKSARSMDQALKNSSSLYDNIGDLFSRLSDSKNNQPLDLQVSPSGQSQMAIQWQPQKADRRIEGGEGGLVLFDHLHVHMMLHSVRLYTPDESRGRELDSRIIPGLPSWVQYYVISSIVLGFIAIGTSHRHWCKIWSLGRRREYRFLLLFLLLWLIHKLLFLVLYIPILGAFSFIWLVISIVYKVVDFLVIRPVRWCYGLLAT